MQNDESVALKKIKYFILGEPFFANYINSIKNSRARNIWKIGPSWSNIADTGII